jgi:hypothetical protein
VSPPKTAIEHIDVVVAAVAKEPVVAAQSVEPVAVFPAEQNIMPVSVTQDHGVLPTSPDAAVARAVQGAS